MSDIIDETEKALLLKVDDAIARAGDLMDLKDIDPDDSDAYDEAFEARFHCGKCVVTNVMETIWEDLNNLMEYYSDRTPKTQ